MRIGMCKKKILLIENPINFKKKLHHGKYIKIYKQKYGEYEVTSRQFKFSHRIRLLLKSFKISYSYGILVFALKFMDFLCIYIGSLSASLDKNVAIDRPSTKKW
jgi:hypothetical protein